MPSTHRVQQGESLISLGNRFKIPPGKIWDHPDNGHLREHSRRSSILYPGDVVTIPDPERKTVAGDTEQRHRFRYSSGTWLRLRLLDEDEPYAGEPYLLVVGETEHTGNLDENGRLEVGIPASAERAMLYLGEDRQEEIEVLIHQMDPIDESSGVQKRLNNLGYDCGAEDGEIGLGTREAIKCFQQDQQLEVTGEIDDATLARLEEIHGS